MYKWKKDNQLIENVKNAVSAAHSYRQVFILLNLKPTGGNYIGLKRLCQEFNIDTSHMLGQGYLRDKAHSWGKKKLNDEDIFKERSEVSRKAVRTRLIKTGRMIYRCALCSCGSEWEGKPLVLQLDHINGVSDDHRIENLRWLCPNCHSQTETFCGKNTAYAGTSPRKLRNKNVSKTTFMKTIAQCLRCRTPLRGGEKYCSHLCANKSNAKPKQTKIQWPAPEAVAKLVWEKPTSQVAKDLGVTDNAVAKFCSKNKISKPPRGYWAGLAKTREGLAPS